MKNELYDHPLAHGFRRALIRFGLPLLAAAFSAGQAEAQTESLLYSYGTTAGDSQAPYGTVAFDANCNMFGITQGNGTSTFGTIWEISKSGTFSTIHTFASTASDGAIPGAGVTFDSSGNMYGTTAFGGANFEGTLWEIPAGGSFKVVYSFGASGSDGINPGGRVAIDGSGNLYGTTQNGGANSGGTVWEIPSGGSYTILYNFGASAADGKNPMGGVAIDSSGNLFGATANGGTNGIGFGTVWKLSSSNSYSVLYNFAASSSDGANPHAGVTIDGSGNLFGTTTYGGAYGEGTLWEIDSSANYTVRHSFGSNASDGVGPLCDVTFDVSGNMFGTTPNGGSASSGTVWEISALGLYSIPYTFAASSSTDGKSPYACPTLDASGNLYGTANKGGANAFGAIFKITPPPPALTAVSLTSASISGGTSTLGAVTLAGPAGPGGFPITLSSNSVYSEVPPTIVVPEGHTLVWFPVWTDPALAGQSATLTGSDGTNVLTANLALSAYLPSVFNVTISPTFVVGGTSATGMVQLDHYVTSPTGEVVDLTSSNSSGSGTAAASVPPSVTVPFGANSATFAISTSSVSLVTGVNIIATDGGSQSGLIMLLPSGGFGLGLTVNPGGIFGGSSSTGTVTLSSAQGTDTVVSLSSNSSTASVPATVTIPAGSTSASFTVTTQAVSGQTPATSGGWVWIAGSAGISAQACPISIYPSVAHSVSASPSSVAGGGTSTGTVTLAGKAPAGGATVTLSSNSADVQVPASVTIPAGAASATFSITTSRVSSSEYAEISASYGGHTAQTAFGIGASVLLHGIVATPGTVTGGTSATGTVTLSAAAPAGGTVVSLSSSNAAVAQVPASVTVLAGNTSATFTITTSAVSSNTYVSAITASLNGRSSSCAVQVCMPSLTSLTTASTTVQGGTSPTITANLSGPAPTGGIAVALSVNSGLASVPVSVVVPAGATSATFVMNTSAVSGTTSVVVTGVLVRTVHLRFNLTH